MCIPYVYSWMSPLSSLLRFPYYLRFPEKLFRTTCPSTHDGCSSAELGWRIFLLIDSGPISADSQNPPYVFTFCIFCPFFWTMFFLSTSSCPLDSQQKSSFKAMSEAALLTVWRNREEFYGTAAQQTFCT